MKKWLLLSFTLLLVFVAACGDSKDDSTNDSQTAENEKSETENNNAITIEDVYGEQTIEGTPKRVVVLEWVYAEDLLALGVQPVGMADIEG